MSSSAAATASEGRQSDAVTQTDPNASDKKADAESRKADAESKKADAEGRQSDAVTQTDPNASDKKADAESRKAAAESKRAVAERPPAERLLLACSATVERLADLLELGATVAKREMSKDQNRDQNGGAQVIRIEPLAELPSAHDLWIRGARACREASLIMHKVIVTWWLDEKSEPKSEAFSVVTGTEMQHFQNQVVRESKVLARLVPFKTPDTKEPVFDWNTVEMVDFNHPTTSYTNHFRLESTLDNHIVVRTVGAENSRLKFDKITAADRRPHEPNFQ